MSKTKELAKNTLVVGAGKMSASVVSLLMLPLYTRFLTPNSYGIVDLVITYSVVIGPTISLQMEMAAFRFLIDARGDHEKVSRVISSSLVSCLGIVTFATLAVLILTFLVTIPYVLIGYLMIISIIVLGISLQIARGLGDNLSFAIATGIVSLTTAIGTVIGLVVISGGIYGALCPIIVSNFIGSIFISKRTDIYGHLKRHFIDKETQISLFKYAIPLIPNGLSWWVINVSDRTIIALLLGVSASGVYAVSNKFSAIFISIFSIFGMTWTESASLHIDARDRDMFFSKVGNGIIEIFGSCCLLLIAATPLLFPVAVGRNFSDAYNYIPLLLVAAFFNAVVGYYSAIYIAKKMTKQVANTSLYGAIINILMNFLLIPIIKIYAAAISTLASYMIMSFYRHRDIRKYISIEIYLKRHLNLLILLGITLLIYYQSNILLQLSWFISITLGITYSKKQWLKKILFVFRDKKD